MHFKQVLLSLSIISVILIFSCDSKEIQDTNTAGDIESKINNANSISNISAELIQYSINSYDTILSEFVIDSIVKLDIVESAEITEDGSGIIVKLEDGIYMNILLNVYSQIDTLENIIGKSANQVSNIYSNTKSIPNGKNAIILAPFQRTFKDNLDAIYFRLKLMGFKVDLFENFDATLDKFRSDFLEQYDVIFISTHGIANGMTRDGERSTLLATGSSINTLYEHWNNQDEKAALGDIEGSLFWHISVPWLMQTSENDYPSSWFFANACESSKIDYGLSSLSHYLMKSGVGGYSGFERTINCRNADRIAASLLELLRRGNSLSEATIQVKKSDLSQSNLLDYSTPSTKEQFYIIKPFEVADIDGNIYKAKKIGNQIWMTANLKTTKFNNGVTIPYIVDNDDWCELSTPAYCWYNNNSETYADAYGALYNRYTINNDKLCPTGWHVPTVDDWSTLIEYLGGKAISGGKLKDTIYWNDPNTGATNEIGFNARPGGYRHFDGNYITSGDFGIWWSDTYFDENLVWYSMTYLYNNVGIQPMDSDHPDYYHEAGMGFSVRCIQD